MSEAWLALQTGAEGFSRPVVVKRLRAQSPKSFLVREASILARLSHPNLVQVFGFDESPDGLFLILEWVNGLTLAEWLSARTFACDRKEWLLASLFVVHEVLSALTYCHQRQPAVVHGDVAPGNILLGKEGHVKLADFGIAAFRHDSAPVDWGNPRYLPPAAAERRQRRPYTDLYAAGVVLQEILAYEEPEIWQAFAEIVRRATAEDPLTRYADAATFQRDVAAAISGWWAEADWIVKAPEALRRLLRISVLPTVELLDRPLETVPLEGGKAAETVSIRTRWLTGALTFIVAGVISLPLAHEDVRFAFSETPVEVVNVPRPVPAAAAKGDRERSRAKPARSHVEIQAAPWAAVFIDTVHQGNTPLRRPVAAGRHHVELRFPGALRPLRRRLVVQPGQSYRLFAGATDREIAARKL